MTYPAPLARTDDKLHDAEPPDKTKALALAFAMPVVFIIVFVATMVASFHDPVPNEMPIIIAGPQASTSQVSDGIEQNAPASFEISRTTDPDVATQKVRERDAVGAIVLGGNDAEPTVTAYIASGGGIGPAGTIQAIGTQIAGQLNAQSDIVELSPLAAQDQTGSSLFSVFIYTTLGGFLALVVLTQLAPKSRLRTKYGVALASSLVVPIGVFGFSSILLDGFGIDSGQLLSLMGVFGLYVFTVALIVIVFEQVFKSSALLLVVPIALFVNFASAGGGVSASMLPSFWQWIHSFWFGAGAYEAAADIVYLPAADTSRWIFQLLMWTVIAFGASMTIEAIKFIRFQDGHLVAQHRALTAADANSSVEPASPSS